MDQILTYILLALATLLAGLSAYKGRQPKALGKSWHIPWNGVLFLSLLFVLLFVRHLLNLSGIDLPAR